MTKQTKLIDAAIEQIKRDLEAGDSTAIAELLTHVPQRNLQAFLPENGAMWDEWFDASDDTYDEFGVNTKNSFNTAPKGEQA